MKQEHTGVGDNVIVNGDYIAVIQKHPSLLGEVINFLGSRILVDDSDELTFAEFNIDDKLDYNNIIECRETINEYKIFQGKIDSLYKEIELMGSNKKRFLLRNIRDHYLKVKGGYLSKHPELTVIEAIRLNSDRILWDVEALLLKEIEKSSNMHHPTEVIKVALKVVIVDAFMRCKILEEPVY